MTRQQNLRKQTFKWMVALPISALLLGTHVAWAQLREVEQTVYGMD